MKKIIFLLGIGFTILCLSGCERFACTENGTDCNILSAKNVVISMDSLEGQPRYFYELISGNKTFAQYTHANGYCNNVFDDEFGETFTFEVNEEVDSYTLTDSEIQEANGFYYQFGAWVSSNWHYPISKGTVKVEKINDKKWSIKIDIETPDLYLNQEPRVLKAEGVFRR